MWVNEGLDIDFSLIIPSRGRIHRLEQCLLSFFNRARRRDNNEAIIIVDLDDTSIRGFDDFLLAHNINGKILHVKRSEMMIRDYNNYGAQCSTGRYVWMLNDDYEVVTDHWDEILKNKIEFGMRANKDRIAYVMVDDSTHSASNWNIMHRSGCCCPILTRETCEALNGVMPWQINSWGADIALFQIFANLPAPRVTDATSDVKVLHHCRHNNTAEVDDISRRIESISRCQGISHESRQVFIDRIMQVVNS